jgi:DNA-binding MarR family transcriptional regulator
MATVRVPKASRRAEPARPTDAAEDDGLRPLVDQLVDHIGTLVRVHSLRDPIGDLAPELTSAQRHAIVALGMAASPLSMSVLAQRIDASLPATTGVVDRLERDGFAERLRDGGDRRVVLVGLTAHGRRTFETLATRMRAEFGRFLAALSVPDRATFVDVFGRAVAVLCDRDDDVARAPGRARVAAAADKKRSSRP